MPQSARDKMLAERIENDFAYHPPTPEQTRIYESIREYAREFALFIAEKCPEGRERSLALTHLEETVMWANAGIARDR